MSTERPLVLALVLCDQIITEHGTMKKSLIGAFNSITVESLPHTYPRMCVYAALTNGQGQATAALRYVFMDTPDGGGRTIWNLNAPIGFDNPNQVVEICFELNQIAFEAAGLHAFELSCGGELLLERRFHVHLRKHG